MAQNVTRKREGTLMDQQRQLLILQKQIEILKEQIENLDGIIEILQDVKQRGLSLKDVCRERGWLQDQLRSEEKEIK